MRVAAAVLACLTAAYATNGATPTDNTVAPEIETLLQRKRDHMDRLFQDMLSKQNAKKGVFDEAHAAYIKAQTELAEAVRIVGLRGQTVSLADAEAAMALRDEAGFKYAESGLVFKANAGQEPKVAIVDWETACNGGQGKACRAGEKGVEMAGTMISCTIMTCTYKKNEGDGMVYPDDIDTRMFYYVPNEGYIDPTVTELSEDQTPYFRPWVRTYMETLSDKPGNNKYWRWGHTGRAKYLGALKNPEGEPLLGEKIELHDRHYFADAPPHMGNNEMNEVNGQATKVLIENSGPDKYYEHLKCGGAEELCCFYEENLKDVDFILVHMSSSNLPGKKGWEQCTDFKCAASSIVEGKQDSATYKQSCARVLQWFQPDKMCNSRYILDHFCPYFNVPPSPDELRQVGLPLSWRATPGENLGSAGWNLIGALVKGNVLPVSAMISGVPDYVTTFDNAPFRVEAPRDLAELLYDELIQSLHVDPMDVGLTLDMTTIICNMFLLDQMNPPAAYDYPKDWEAIQRAAREAAAKAAAATAEDEDEDEAQEAYAGKWIKEWLEMVRAAVESLAIPHPDEGGQA